jgi:hypothetical protein
MPILNLMISCTIVSLIQTLSLFAIHQYYIHIHPAIDFTSYKQYMFSALNGKSTFFDSMPGPIEAAMHSPIPITPYLAMSSLISFCFIFACILRSDYENKAKKALETHNNNQGVSK